MKNYSSRINQFVTSASVGKNIDDDLHAGTLFYVTTNKKGVSSHHFG